MKRREEKSWLDIKFIKNKLNSLVRYCKVSPNKPENRSKSLQRKRFVVMKEKLKEDKKLEGQIMREIKLHNSEQIKRMNRSLLEHNKSKCSQVREDKTIGKVKAEIKKQYKLKCPIRTPRVINIEAKTKILREIEMYEKQLIQELEDNHLIEKKEYEKLEDIMSNSPFHN